MEFSLLGAVLVAVLSTYLVLRFEAGRTNAADCTRDLWDALLTAAIAGLAVGRIVAMLRDGTNPITDAADLLIVRGGVDTAAAAITALAVMGWILRADLWWMADAAAPAAIAGLAGWHGGCLVRDACLGTPSDLPWAISQAGSTVSRHPVEIYATLLLAVAAVGFVVWKHRRRPTPGVVAGVALVVAGSTRLVTEPMRPSLGAGPWWVYVAGIVLGAVIVGVRLRRPAGTRSDAGDGVEERPDL